MSRPVREARSHWTRVTWVVLLTSAFVLLGLAFERHDRQLFTSAEPAQDHYRSVVQYQIALLRLQAELRTRAAGGAPEPDALMLRASVVVSRTHVLTNPSELTQFFWQLPGYGEATRRFAALAERVRPLLQAGMPTPAEAQALLPELAQADAAAVRFASEVLAAEFEGQEALRTRLRQQRSWLWLLLSTAWAGLLVGLLMLDRSRRRHRKIARERQAALVSEQQAVASMQAALQARTEFVGLVSHELRSPLQSILSALDLLELQGTPAEPCDVGEFVGRVRRAADALDVQLRDLLTLAQGETGHLEVRPEPFEAVALVEDLVERWRTEARRKGLQLQLDAPAQPLFVVADPVRLAQVVSNLVSNAVKYTRSGRVRIALEAPATTESPLTITVSDTGPGIPAAFLPLIFGAYRRFASSERRAESSGIGLAVVQTIMAHLGGTVSVDSREGHGTVFRISLPVVCVEEAPSGRTSSARRRLLLVDDRRDVLDGLADVAGALGHDCDSADNAAMAANLLAAKDYELVLIDLEMPVKSGEQLAWEIRREHGRNSTTRLIAMSAAPATADTPAWPFDGFVQKPIDRHALAALMQVAAEPASPA